MLIKSYDHLLEIIKQKKKMKVAVITAEHMDVLEVVSEAEKMGLAEFVLLGDPYKIEKVISENNLTLSAEIIDEKDHHKAADKAVDLVVSGEADTVMKGMLHSAIFLRAILNKEKGLNTGNIVTQIAVQQKPNKDGLLLITDCGITVTPDLMQKKMILENAVEFAHKLGYENPRVAVLAAVEVINPSMPDTIDAAALSKMADRGQIEGCIVDGPLALDNAISVESAEHKGIKGPVAGNADILLVPNVTVGNTLMKSIAYFANEPTPSVMMGVRLPIVYTSRTEGVKGRLLTIALARFLSNN